MFELFMIGLSCLVCILLAFGMWYVTQSKEIEMSPGRHTAIEVSMWRDENPSATLDAVIAKTKEIESNNPKPSPVLLMTRQQITDASKQYPATKADRRTFLVIASDDVMKPDNAFAEEDTRYILRGIDYEYLSQKFPYQNYVV